MERLIYVFINDDEIMYAFLFEDLYSLSDEMVRFSDEFMSNISTSN